MLDPARPLILVGGGKMGEALLVGWLGQGVPPEAILVVEPSATRRELLAAGHGVPTFAAPEELPRGLAPAGLLLAVKPQMMDAALPAYARLVAPDTLVQYKVDAHYDPARDLGLLWNDTDLGIAWPVTSETAIVIDKDKKHPRLRDLPHYFAWTEKA